MFLITCELGHLPIYTIEGSIVGCKCSGVRWVDVWLVFATGLNELAHTVLSIARLDQPTFRCMLAQTNSWVLHRMIAHQLSLLAVTDLETNLFF
jgi:hypothetical protein